MRNKKAVLAVSTEAGLAIVLRTINIYYYHVKWKEWRAK